MKSLVVYYSYSGNTKQIAQMIQKETGSDIARIQTVKPYTGNYDAVVRQGRIEVNNRFEPEIKPIDIDTEAYGAIFIGTPVWWYTFAPAVRTFLNANGWAGKKAYPFASSGGWPGRTFEDFRLACEGAHVDGGLHVKFDETRLATPVRTVLDWINSKRAGWSNL